MHKILSVPLELGAIAHHLVFHITLNKVGRGKLEN